MATIGQYVSSMRTVQQDIADKMGSSLSNIQAQVTVRSMLVILAVIVKALVDKGVITDQELNQSLNVVRNALHEPEPDQPTPRPPS